MPRRTSAARVSSFASDNVCAPAVEARERGTVVSAFSPARIAFDMAGERIEHGHDAVLLVRTKIGVLASVTDEEVRLANAQASSTELEPTGKELRREADR